MQKPVALSVMIATGAALAATFAGCTAPEGPRRPDSRFLSQKVPAVKEAVESGDTRVVPQLVSDLESDDPAVRFFAIEGLKRLTGETFGYEYYADADARREPVTKWRQWLEAHPPGEHRRPGDGTASSSSSRGKQ
jgi:hypothetical protein